LSSVVPTAPARDLVASPPVDTNASEDCAPGFFVEGTGVVFREHSQQGDSAYTVEVRSDWRAMLVLRGAGTIGRVYEIIDVLDRGDAATGDCPPMLGAVDLSGVRSAPVRAQFILGRWLLGRRNKFARIAVFEGRPFAMMLGRTAMKIARFHNVGFFQCRREAYRWLEEAAPRE